MTIERYFSEIKATVDRIATPHFVAATNVNFETRPGGQGFLSGVINFADGSKFYFREYLDATRDSVEKIMYSYHYQDSASKLILRYDNSAHRPALESFEHKHDSTGATAHPAPRLDQVLAEIIELQKWV